MKEIGRSCQIWALKVSPQGCYHLAFRKRQAHPYWTNLISRSCQILIQNLSWNGRNYLTLPWSGGSNRFLISDKLEMLETYISFRQCKSAEIDYWRSLAAMQFESLGVILRCVESEQTDVWAKVHAIVYFMWLFILTIIGSHWIHFNSSNCNTTNTTGVLNVRLLCLSWRFTMQAIFKDLYSHCLHDIMRLHVNSKDLFDR